jgi:hypothetical protein
MALLHVIEVHSIDKGPGGRRAYFPDRTAKGVAGAKRGDGEPLALACAIAELCVISEGDGHAP